MRTPFLIFIVLTVLISGCGKKSFQWRSTHALTMNELPKPRAMAEKTFRYAFSGQVIDEMTGEAISQFSISLLGPESNDMLLLNPLGDRGGMFHVSRHLNTESVPFITLSFLLSARGFGSVVQTIDVGADCIESSCPGVRPTPFYLKKLMDAGLPPQFGADRIFLPTTIGQMTKGKDIVALFEQAQSLGKISNSIEKLKAAAESKTAVRFLVELHDSSTEQAEHVLRPLLATFSKGDRHLPEASGWLSYLAPSRLSEEESMSARTPMHRVISTTLASPVFFESLLSLRHVSSPQKITDEKTILLYYLSPIAQGLASDRASVIAENLDNLVRSGGVSALKNFYRDSKINDRFAAISPFIDTIVTGLNSSAGNRLSDLLSQMFVSKRPSKAITDFVGKSVTFKGGPQFAGVSAVLFPTLASFAQVWLPGKRILAAQIATPDGVSELKGISLVQDLPASPAVVLKGPVREMLKLAYFPNVKKLSFIQDSEK